MELPILVRSELIMVSWMLGVTSLTGTSPAAIPVSTPFTKAFTCMVDDMKVKGGSKRKKEAGREGGRE